MRTQYYTATSLDGWIADAGHSLDWLFEASEGLGETGYDAFIREVGAIAMGSSTYEWMLRNHVRPGSDAPQPWPYEVPCWIFSSRSLPGIPDADLRFVSGAVAPVHAAMKEAAAGRNIWIAGGGDLAGQFHDQGLLDELIIQIAPVLLGEGAPLLPRRIPATALRLSSVERLGSFVQLRYTLTPPGTSG